MLLVQQSAPSHGAFAAFVSPYLGGYVVCITSHHGMGNVVFFAVPFGEPVAAAGCIIENDCRVLQSIYVNQLSRFSILDKTEGPALDFVWPVDPPPEGHVQGQP